MRKRGKTHSRRREAILSPKQHGDLIVIPRTHLALLLDGYVEQESVQAVLGVLNLALAVLKVRGVEAADSGYAQAQSILDNVGRTLSAPTEDEGRVLQAVLNHADRYIGIQPKSILRQAYMLAVKEIESKYLEAE